MIIIAFPYISMFVFSVSGIVDARARKEEASEEDFGFRVLKLF